MISNLKRPFYFAGLALLAGLYACGNAPERPAPDGSVTVSSGGDSSGVTSATGSASAPSAPSGAASAITQTGTSPISSGSACSSSIAGGVASPFIRATDNSLTAINGLYQRPEGPMVSVVGPNDGVANNYSVPFQGALGGQYLMFWNNQFLTFTGKGYFSVMWEFAYFNRGGVIDSVNAPSMSVISGTVRRVALAGQHYMPDSAIDGTPGTTGVWRAGLQNLTPPNDFVAMTAPPATVNGMPAMWQTEYYYLDGTVKIAQHEGSPDYNISLTPVMWTDVNNDLDSSTVYSSKWSSRPGISLDPFSGVKTPASPDGLAATALSSSHVHVSWNVCSDNENGFVVEASRSGSFGDDAAHAELYALGALYDVVASVPAGYHEADLSALLPSTTYMLRVHSFNDGGDSAQSSTVQVTTPPATVPAPPPWASADIGIAASGTVSSTSGDRNHITLRAGSGDMWGVSDSLRFNYQPIVGDFTFTARLIGEAYTAPTAKAALIARQSLDPGSAYVAAIRQPNLYVGAQWRFNSGGWPSTGSGPKAIAGEPVWLKLQRRGDSYTMQSSIDDITWSTLGKTTQSMGQTINVGMSLSALGEGGVAAFDQIILVQP